MTDTFELPSGLPEGPWKYRPLEFDDWGFVRAADGALVAVSRSGTHNYVDHDACRAAKTDPYEKIGRAIASIPAMAAEIERLQKLADSNLEAARKANIRVAEQFGEIESLRAQNAELRTISGKLDFLSFVIESAVRTADPKHHAQTVALLTDNRAVLAKEPAP